MSAITYPFTEDEVRVAHDEWGLNCGPAALAFACQVKLQAAKVAIPLFQERGYTNPTMMREALEFLGRRFIPIATRNQRRTYPSGYLSNVDAMFAGPMSLVRIQWTGPWIIDGKPARWAAQQTHWIATWAERGVPLVFDINGGIQGFGKWEAEIVPAIVATIKRADGDWYPVNIWRLSPPNSPPTTK